MTFCERVPVDKNLSAIKQTVGLNCGATIEIEVLPCPFCGQLPQFTHRGNMHHSTQSIITKCSNVSCRFEREDKIFTARSQIENTLAYAVKHWNKRV